VEHKVARHGYAQVKYEFLRIVLKWSTWLNILSYFSPVV